MPATGRPPRSFPTVSPFQAKVLFVVGLFMILASIAMIALETYRDQEVDLWINVVLIGVGALFMVPRRVLWVLEKLPKLFGK